MSFLIRILAFCRKELSSSARQPLKLLGLVLGPFIIMAIFAAGYNGSNKFDTALVVPNRAGVSTQLADYESLSKDTFNIVRVTNDRNAALADLNEGRLGVVIVVPDDALEQIYGGQSAQFPVYYRQLSPLLANYIEYSTYVYASEFDKVVLREALAAAKPQTAQLTEYTNQINASTDRLEAAMRNNQPQLAQIELERMKTITTLARSSVSGLIVPGATDQQSKDRNLVSGALSREIVQNTVGNFETRLTNIDGRLKAIDQGLQNNDLNSPQQTQNVTGLRQENAALAKETTRLAAIPPAVLVSPVLSKAKNTIKTEAKFTNFYAPAVVILLLQHIGITLAALSIVRERQLGAIEIYRVAPINPTEILIGKFLSYTILLMIVGSLLLGAMYQFLGVPFLGDLLLGAGVLLTAAFASIGLGFLVAGLSRTETQAVQWSMLLMLGSLFFTGFMVPLIQFNEFVRYISYALPMTYSTANLQDVMLDNRTPTLFNLLMPIALGALYFLIGRFLYKRQYSIS